MINQVKRAPVGISLLLVVGPSLVWCSEYIGSGEVILATRAGAILGTSILWAIFIGIFLKFWIGMSAARYTVATGEGMIDMISRMPGPRNLSVWIVLVAQFLTAAIAIGSLASAAGIFASAVFGISRIAGGWIVTIFALLISWSGRFSILRVIMSILVFIVIAGVFSIVIRVFPGIDNILKGFMFEIPEVPAWAIEQGANPNPWAEILPLIGWGAGGFASQVWYTYWVIGAGYGMAEKDGYGRPADVQKLQSLEKGEIKEIQRWFRVVKADASLAMIIGVFTTSCFLIAGAGVLHSIQLAPGSEKLAHELSSVFSVRWGKLGGLLFMLGGLAALISTQIGQLAGWPRLLADSFRICIPRFSKIEWKTQYRLFLVFFFISNMTLIYTLGFKPVALVKLSAILDGLLLTPLQAIWVFVGLYWIQPKMFGKEKAKLLRPTPITGIILIIAFLVFSYFCIYQIPKVL